jgi:hypothetical protein
LGKIVVLQAERPARARENAAVSCFSPDPALVLKKSASSI